MAFSYLSFRAQRGICFPEKDTEEQILRFAQHDSPFACGQKEVVSLCRALTERRDLAKNLNGTLGTGQLVEQFRIILQPPYRVREQPP